MKTILLRTGSGSVLARSSFIPDSPRISASPRESLTGVKKSASSPRLSVHFEPNRGRGIRRTSSESDVIRSKIKAVAGAEKSLPFPERIPEEKSVPENEISVEDVGFPGGGIGNNRKFTGGGGGRDGCNADRSKLGAYYQEVINSNPTNSVLLRNYAKYLHEVEGDTVKAEEYYGRAILASPGDGEVLSLYGKLIWETERDENRAKSYFDQAVHASPDDCTVLGSYAHFLWQAEEDDTADEDCRVEMVGAL
nr:Signal transduction response regulator [Ipomoea batatas]GME10056.1 Signal transduction response regulator [Ipomoea batatas]